MVRRSSGIPRDKAIGGLGAILRGRTAPKTVTRPTKSTGSLDQTTETTASHTESLYLFRPQEAVADTMAGERITGDLGGLAIADGTVDLSKDDRVTYGGVEYELDTIVGVPEDDEPDGTDSPNTDYWRLSFVRRQ